jgi:hypothetical protein
MKTCVIPALVLWGLLCGLTGCPTGAEPAAKNSDAALKNISVSAGTLDPDFAPETTAYTVAVAHAVEQITVTGAASHEEATVLGGGEQSLNVGQNAIPLIVTAQDGTTGIYTVTVSRGAAAIDATVNSLELDAFITAPVSDAAPDTTIDGDQYAGTIEWRLEDGTPFTGAAFRGSTVYRAAVTLAAKPGYTFAGVGADSFTHAGAAAITNAIDSGTAVLVFPATGISLDTAAPGEAGALDGVPGIGLVTLSWTDPEDGDLDHLEITLTPVVAGITQPLVAAPGAGTKIVKGLANNTAYTFTVQTVDAAGNRSAGTSLTRTPQTGLAWTKAAQDIFTGSASVSEVIWTGAQFVAVGGGGRMASSPDGVTWTAVTDSGFGTTPIYSIVWNGSIFVAGGQAGKMARSTDGISWTAVTDSVFGNNNIFSIAWNGAKFVAVGSGGRMASSPDGATWNQVISSSFGTTQIQGIIWNGSTFAAFGANKIALSTDGATWTQAPAENKPGLSLTPAFQDIAWDGAQFVIVGYSGTMFRSTNGGEHWAAAGPSISGIFGTAPIYGITWSSSIFLAVGRGRMAASPDGTTWTAVTDTAFLSSDTLSKAAYGDGRFVVVGDGFIAYSNIQ